MKKPINPNDRELLIKVAAAMWSSVRGSGNHMTQDEAVASAQELIAAADQAIVQSNEPTKETPQ